MAENSYVMVRNGPGAQEEVDGLWSAAVMRGADM